MNVQELITRGRMVMASAPSRLAVFDAVDGKRNAADIAAMTRRSVTNVHRDLAMLRDAGLLEVRASGRRGVVYEKVPLARTISRKYFEPTAKRPKAPAQTNRAPVQRAKSRTAELAVPSEVELLEIARRGEDQLHEFKSQGCDVSKIAREIAAMANTAAGGLIFYGIDDDGNIEGSDVSCQKFDQPLQNSVKNTISPALTVKVAAVSALGSEVLVIVVPAWNREDVYQYGEKILIRKGTNVFAAKPEEVRRLHRGESVV